MEYSFFKRNSFLIDNSFRNAVFSYFPVAGWVVPLFMEKADAFWQHHARQGFLLSIFFVFVAMFLNMINFFIPEVWMNVRFGLVIAIYLFYFLYAVLSVYCMIASFRRKAFSLIFVRNFFRYIDL